MVSFRCCMYPPTCCQVSCRLVRKGGQGVIPAKVDSHTARVPTNWLNECMKQGPSLLRGSTYITVNVLQCVKALKKSISWWSDGRWLKINTFVFPRRAVTHQLRDWSDWSISALIWSRHPHLVASQGHTSQNSQIRTMDVSRSHLFQHCLLCKVSGPSCHIFTSRQITSCLDVQATLWRQ